MQWMTDLTSCTKDHYDNFGQCFRFSTLFLIILLTSQYYSLKNSAEILRLS